MPSVSLALRAQTQSGRTGAGRSGLEDGMAAAVNVHLTWTGACPSGPGQQCHVHVHTGYEPLVHAPQQDGRPSSRFGHRAYGLYELPPGTQPRAQAGGQAHGFPAANSRAAPTQAVQGVLRLGPWLGMWPPHAASWGTWTA
ncbi:hypothetical protein ACKKBG_A03685 [Auxenochlorella protothecoides x Auxenochlorella symbiontica]